MVALHIKDLSKSFGSTEVLKKINLEIEEGSFLVLLGPSGCGKSTLLNIIAGLETIDEGAVLIDDYDVNKVEPKDRNIAMVFQSYALFPHMSVVENVSYGLKMINVPKEEYIQKSFETLKLVGLESYEKRMPSELSGGQQQRVAVARAIVLEPKVLLFDEPLSNLDAKLRRQVREDIRELQQELGVTTIYVTHDQEEALAISDKVIVMNNAVIAQEGRPKDLYNNPKTTFVANFIGDANIVKARIETRNENNYDINFGGIQMKISSNIALKDSVSIALRPETIEIIKEKTNNCMAAKIINASYVGSCYQYVVSSSVGELFIVSNETINHFKLNEEVFITFDESGVTILED